MAVPGKPNGQDRTDTFGVIRNLLRRHSILSSESAESAAPVLTFRTNSHYVVAALTPADRGLPPNLSHQIVAHASTPEGKQKRTAIIAGVDSIFQPIDFLILSAKFGSGFDRFLLLNPVAVDACNALGVKLKIIGSTHDSDLVNPKILLACTFWT